MRPNTLITDFDNTLYDWFEVWYQSFTAMLSEVKIISGLEDDTLLPEIRTIHQQFGTSEYSFLLESLPCLKAKYPKQDIAVVFDDAIHAYRSARKSALRLFDGVAETLEHLKAEGILVVVYTESLAYYTNYRIHRLGLDGLVDYIYSPPDHELPQPTAHNVGNTASTEESLLEVSHHRFLPEGVFKPNPEVLLDIVEEIERKPSECIYLGDSLMKDIAMAQDANVTDVYAEYGVVQEHKGYPLLRSVSHWTDEDVEREKALSRRDVLPSHTISKFSQITDYFG